MAVARAAGNEGQFFMVIAHFRDGRRQTAIWRESKAELNGSVAVCEGCEEPPADSSSLPTPVHAFIHVGEVLLTYKLYLYIK